MKKFVAILLALLLALANVAALAEGLKLPDISGVVNSEGADAPYSFNKSYTTTGTNTSAFPAETLKFNVAVASGKTNPDSTMISVADFTVEKQTNNVIPVTVPTPDATHFTEVGVYEYDVTEVTGDGQAVDYFDETTDIIHVRVFIIYDDTKTDGSKKINYVQVWTEIEKDEKTDDVENTFEVGSLTVTKEVTGALGDKDLDFTVTIDLETESGMKVYNDITIAAKDAKATVVSDTTIDGDGWTGKKTVTITVKDGGSVTISDIPAGVKYTVKETKAGDDAIVMLDDSKDDPNNTAAYYVTYDGTMATDAGATGDIATSAAKVEIVNAKEMDIPTGITLETLPYVLILAVAVMGAAVLVIRKREEY